MASRDTFANDPHRPIYHFLPPANWMNDPNGLIHWQGQYHLFYQHNPYGPWHEKIHWGHAVSRDLVHWEHLPIALEPTPYGPDADGCWSGCAVVHDGVPTLFYSGVYPQVVCVATSNGEMIAWHKYEDNPVISHVPDSIDAGDPWEFRDPYVWQEDGTWYMLMGTRIVGEGGAILLYRSSDLHRWEFMHTLVQGDRNQLDPFWTGTIWECPNLIKLGNRHVLIISFQHHETGQLLYTGYFMGRYENHHFTPESQHILDYGSHFYAPQVMRDAHGRSIMFGWLWEGRSEAEQRKAGWAGVMSLPRLLTMRNDGLLGIEPVPELQKLRGEQAHFEALTIINEAHYLLEGVEGDCLEIKAVIKPEDATQFGLKVRCSPDGREETWVLFDVPHQFVTIEREKSSLANSVSHDLLPARQVARNAPLKIVPGEPIQLHIFLDKSVLEVFVNGRITLSSRIYPTLAHSLGVALFANNGRINITSLDIWRLNAANAVHLPA